MGAAELLSLQDAFPSIEEEILSFKGTNCLDSCTNPTCGKAPFVRVNGNILHAVTVESLKKTLHHELERLK